MEKTVCWRRRRTVTPQALISELRSSQRHGWRVPADASRDTGPDWSVGYHYWWGQNPKGDDTMSMQVFYQQVVATQRLPEGAWAPFTRLMRMGLVQIRQAAGALEWVAW